MSLQAAEHAEDNSAALMTLAYKKNYSNFYQTFSVLLRVSQKTIRRHAFQKTHDGMTFTSALFNAITKGELEAVCPFTPRAGSLLGTIKPMTTVLMM